MELIVAVYDDWGIGRDGTQPVALKADRSFFRETTRGAAVILGRRTLEDFPGKKPLPGRVNIALSQNAGFLPGFRLCRSVEEALEAAKEAQRVFVIGGASVYRQMLPYCDRAYVTKLHTAVESDCFFPNLDESPEWEQTQRLREGEENGIRYEMVLYERKPLSGDF